MDAVVLIAAPIYGMLVGSFLNVVIHRVPAGRSVLRPRSACPGCDTPISGRDNVPVVSWLLLRGRCRGCGTAISPRYPAVEVFTGVAFLVMALRFGSAGEVIAYCVFVAGLIAVSVIDLDCRRIPTRILQVTGAVGGATLGVVAVVRGDLWPLARAGLGAVGCFGVLFLIHIVSPRGMGFGDVRLAGLIGFFLGWLGPLHPAIGLFLGFLLGSVAGVTLMVVGRAGRRSALPFGPFLALGALVTVMLGESIATWYSG
jgi:leader peptidase (prepilin peptidase)/N-methyltransferase